MANICENSIYVYTTKDNESELLKFFDMLDATDGKFGELLPTFEDKNRAGGYLYNCTVTPPWDKRDDEYVYFNIKGDSKWTYPSYFFRYLFSKYNIKGLEVGYYSEEPGCEVFEKDDPLGIFESINFYISNDVESFCVDNVEEVLKALQDYMSKYKTRKYKKLKEQILSVNMEDAATYFDSIGILPIKYEFTEGKINKWFNIYTVVDKSVE